MLVKILSTHEDAQPDTCLCMLGAEKEFPVFVVAGQDRGTSQLCHQDYAGIEPALIAWEADE